MRWLNGSRVKWPMSEDWTRLMCYEWQRWIHRRLMLGLRCATRMANVSRRSFWLKWCGWLKVVSSLTRDSIGRASYNQSGIVRTKLPTLKQSSHKFHSTLRTDMRQKLTKGWAPRRVLPTGASELTFTKKTCSRTTLLFLSRHRLI